MKMKKIFKDYLKTNILFLILIPIIVIGQIIILKPHLKYGFSDVDWGFLSIYKTQNPYSLSQFIKNIEVGGTLGGVYTHQIYYIGIQNDFFGLNFQSFQITTHVFRILAILSVFPLVLFITGSSLAAFVAVILFSFSYSAIGTLYTVVTSSDYSAIFSLGIFVFVYRYIVKNNIGRWFQLLLLLFLLILTLFLSTERMYQLPIFIALIEAFLIWQGRRLEKNTIKRLILMFVPLFIIFLARPMVFLSYFMSHVTELIKGVQGGEWNLLLTPLAALGSMVLPHDYIKFLGVPRIESLESFAEFIITGPLFIIIFTSIVIGTVIFRRFYTVIQILILMVFSSGLLYVLASHFSTHQISVETITQAFIGFYILAIAVVSFFYWQKNKSRLLIGMFVGPLFAFLYIFLTWLGAAAAEVFTGIHRYLTIPAIFIDLFLGTLFTISFNNLSNTLRKFRLNKHVALLVFIPLFFFVTISLKEIRIFFEYQLANGFGASDKNLMRSQLNKYLDNLSITKPSFFYFDFTQDNDKGYYYDNALLAGFSSWMLWHKSIGFNMDLAPTVGWNNIDMLKKSVIEQEDRLNHTKKKVIYYRNKYYDISNFYAFKLNNKKITDIKKEILTEIGIYTDM